MNSPDPGEQFQLPFPERRAVARTPMGKTPGRIAASGLERLCHVRDLSPIGIGLEARDLPRPGQRVWVETDETARAPAVIVWRDPGRCGLRFERDQELPFSGEGTLPPATRQRMTRFLIHSPARIDGPEGSGQAEVVDISIGGVKLHGDIGIDAGSEAVVRIEGLNQPLAGRIQWQTGDIAGFRFDRPLASEDLFSFLCCRAA